MQDFSICITLKNCHNEVRITSHIQFLNINMTQTQFNKVPQLKMKTNFLGNNLILEWEIRYLFPVYLLRL
jgi:hypothetical protein